MKPLLSIILLASVMASSRAADAKPNIVFILADDMRWDAMSCAGNPLLKTPHLDRLAAGGMRFSNAFVTTPICMTSRASILTGQYARRHGVNDFFTPLPDPGITYPVLLRAAGYFTGFIGKWGVNPEVSGEFAAWGPRFDFWAGDMSQTLFWHSRDCAWLRGDGVTDRGNVHCDCGAEARRSEGVHEQGPHPSLKDPVHAETEFVPAQIRSFLDRRDPSKPFCLSVSLKAPHAPWGGYAPRFAKEFEGESIPRRPSVNEAEALRQPDFLRRSLDSDLGLGYAKDTQLDGPRNRAFRQYYRLIQGVDFCVGEVIKELEERGLTDRTVVVFSSDNGYFSGEHGFSGKWLLHEESIRVPMIILDPRLPAAQRGKVCAELALNIDLHPTFLALAGLAVPPQVQGRSLLPQLEDPAQPLREGFFLEHHFTHHPDPPKHIEPSEGYRTRDGKYIRYIVQEGPDREQLHDLRDDPYEMKNLAREPAAQLLLQRLREAHQRGAEELR